jgi:hypothetical protein
MEIRRVFFILLVKSQARNICYFTDHPFSSSRGKLKREVAIGSSLVTYYTNSHTFVSPCWYTCSTCISCLTTGKTCVCVCVCVCVCACVCACVCTRVCVCVYIYRYAVAQMVEALRYKPEGRSFDSRRSHWTFSSTWSFRPHYSPEVESASNRIPWGLKTTDWVDNLTTSMCRLSWNLGTSNSWNP